MQEAISFRQEDTLQTTSPRWIEQIDINPLIVSGEGFVALDARRLQEIADQMVQAIAEGATGDKRKRWR